MIRRQKIDKTTKVDKQTKGEQMTQIGGSYKSLIRRQKNYSQILWVATECGCSPFVLIVVDDE